MMIDDGATPAVVPYRGVDRSLERDWIPWNRWMERKGKERKKEGKIEAKKRKEKEEKKKRKRKEKANCGEDNEERAKSVEFHPDGHMHMYSPLNR